MEKTARKWVALAFGGVVAWGIAPSLSFAGVFNLPHFVLPGEFAVGVEPELGLSGGAGVGVNFKYTQGISDLNNLSVQVGTGAGQRQLRAGAAFSFEFFPDTESQPGIGLAVQGLYVRSPLYGSWETTGIPYVRKTFKTPRVTIEPFIAIPVGIVLTQGSYQAISTLVFGTLFEHNEHFRSVIEFGITTGNSYTYLSGGFVYYH